MRPKEFNMEETLNDDGRKMPSTRRWRFVAEAAAKAVAFLGEEFTIGAFVENAPKKKIQGSVSLLEGGASNADLKETVYVSLALSGKGGKTVFAHRIIEETEKEVLFDVRHLTFVEKEAKGASSADAALEAATANLHR